MVKVDSLTTTAQELDQSRVAFYMRNFDQAEPVIVYEDREQAEMTVADGNHRVEAAKRLGRTDIKSEVRPGTRHAATTYQDLGPREPHADAGRG